MPKFVSCVATVLLFASLANAQILVNELDTGPADAGEFLNNSATATNLGGWSIGYGATNPQLNWITRSFSLPGNNSIAAGAVFVVRESTGTSVPAGVLVFDDGSNIPWPTAAPGGRGGDAVVINPQGQGVDAVVWLNPVGVNNLAGASFTGSYSPSSATFFRNSLIDTDTASDWSDGALTLGALNPGQFVVPTLDLGVTTSGSGDISWVVTSLTPPLPNAEIYNFASFVDSVPNGSGPFFGIGIDAITQVATPADPAGIFHTFLDGSGVWSLNLGPGVVPPIHVEFVSITLTATGVGRISNVVALTF